MVGRDCARYFRAYGFARAVVVSKKGGHHCSRTASPPGCVGLPLIISDRVGAAGSTDIARPGENVILFPVGDVQAIADAVLRVANDPDLRDRMSAASARIYDELDMKRSGGGGVLPFQDWQETRPSARPAFHSVGDWWTASQTEAIW